MTVLNGRLESHQPVVQTNCPEIIIILALLKNAAGSRGKIGCSTILRATNKVP